MSKKRRGTKGEGTVYKRGNKWYGSYELNKTSSGKRQKEYFKGKTKKEVKRQIKKFSLEYEEKPEYKKSDVKFIDYAEDFMFEHYKPQRKASTFERNMSIFNAHLVDAPFAQKKKTEIKESNIQNFINNVKRKDNDSKKKELEPYSIKKIGLLLKMIFEQAVKDKIMLKNPAEDIDYPKKVTNVDTVEDLKPIKNKFTKEKYYQKYELDKYRDSLKGEEFDMLFIFEIYTGLRHSEIVALNWDDISFKDKKVNVTKTLRRVKVFNNNRTESEIKWQYDTPKSPSGVRYVSLTNSLIKKLKQYKKEQEKYFEKNNISNPENLVFTDKAGRKIMPNKIKDFNEYIAEKAGVRYLNFHGLRHTYATRLFEQRVPLNKVANLIGHKSFETTYEIYIHVTELMEQDTMKCIENI